MMVNGRVLAFLASTLFALPASTEPWDKPPEQWDLADSYKILRDSPWTPSETKFEANFTQRHRDNLTGLVIDSPTNEENAPLIRGVEVSRDKPLPLVDFVVVVKDRQTGRAAPAGVEELAQRAGGDPNRSIVGLCDYH